MELPSFDYDFAVPAEWAAMYRQLGLQAVPAKMPVRGGEWKMPALASWAEFQENLIPQATFDRWYGSGGEHANRQNMGILTGRCSGNVFVIDLDDQKGPEAQAWWHGLIELHNNGIDLETVEQRTGGGGRQKLFRAPMDWLAPTNKTAIHIDVRGQGGFAMMPGSMHESGRCYEWMPGCAPWEIEIAAAPEWLLEAIDTLIVKHGSRPRTQHTASPETRKNAFGTKIIEGRESYMRDMIWRVVLDWYRLCPVGPPPAAESTAKMEEAWAVYEDCVGSRLPPEEGVSNADLLERENRGHSLFANKWRRELKNWGSPKMSREAKVRTPSPQSGHSDRVAEAKVDAAGQPLPLILTAPQFIAGFRPPDYLVDGMLQRSYLISLTARTGHGKTAVAMLLGACIARGVPFHGKPVEQGSVLFLAGENPDDIRARYLALAESEGFDPEGIPFYFVDGVIDIVASWPRIAEEALKIPNLSLVMIDTQAAFFLGDEGNSNEQQGQYARVLRRLTTLPGKPAALVNCHPVKNAAQDNLIPMGGSAFLNEVDANLTLWAEDKACTLGPHPDKWRGVAFESMAFELKQVEADRLKDTKGRPIPSVIASPITEAGAERRAAVSEEDEKIVLRLLNVEKDASLATVARRAGWFWPDGQPARNKVARITDRLVKGKLLYKIHGGKYRLKKAACKLIGVKWEHDDDDD